MNRDSALCSECTMTSYTAECKVRSLYKNTTINIAKLNLVASHANRVLGNFCKLHTIKHYKR